MKYAHRAFVAGAAILAAAGAAGESAEGGWRGTLVTGAGTELSVDLVVRAVGDGYGAYLDGSRVARRLGWASERRDGVRGSDPCCLDALGAEFEGSLEGDGLTGVWRQPGTELPLTLVAYRRPVPGPDEIAHSAGTWSGSVGDVPIELRFEVDELGELICAVTVVPQNFTFHTGPVTVDGSSMRLEATRLGVMTATANGNAMAASCMPREARFPSGRHEPANPPRDSQRTSSVSAKVESAAAVTKDLRCSRIDSRPPAVRSRSSFICVPAIFGLPAAAGGTYVEGRLGLISLEDMSGTGVIDSTIGFARLTGEVEGLLSYKETYVVGVEVGVEGVFGTSLRISGSFDGFQPDLDNAFSTPSFRSTASRCRIPRTPRR